ncbi:MAG: tetratricopeptide repeat protein [Deltaproteobacteria bacterium]|nr:tetratricopeptide repeat protein [Deltaproteobacteria bacterium]
MERSMRQIGCFLLFLCLLASALDARAEDRARAKELFLQGETLYKLGRFAQALEAYSQAYKAAPLPGFLFNIGQCHRQLGDFEQAIFFFRGYLREKPKASNRQVVEALIVESQQAQAAKEAEKKRQAELDREQAERARQLAEQEKQRKRELELARIRQQEKQRELELEKARLAALTASQEKNNTEPAFYETWWFWTVVGVVVVGAAAGGTVWGLSGEDVVLPSGSLGTLDRRGL